MKRQKKQSPAIGGGCVAGGASTRKQSPQAADSRAGFLRQNAGRLIILAAITFFAYIPAIGGHYIWDDDQYVTQNHTLQSAARPGPHMARARGDPSVLPACLQQLLAGAPLWGLNPAGYHVVNVLLHICVAGLLFYILQYLHLPGAWLAALIFALHPVHVETVAWISERKNVLSGLFYMGSAVFFLRFFRAEMLPGATMEMNNGGITLPGWCCLSAPF